MTYSVAETQVPFLNVHFTKDFNHLILAVYNWFSVWILSFVIFVFVWGNRIAWITFKHYACVLILLKPFWLNFCAIYHFTKYASKAPYVNARAIAGITHNYFRWSVPSWHDSWCNIPNSGVPTINIFKKLLANMIFKSVLTTCILFLVFWFDYLFILRFAVSL